MTAFVLGNGVSRQSVDLLKLNKLGPIYGCNALYREHTPTVLVATDRPIATAIQESGYSLTNRFYTRKPMANSGAMAVPRTYYGNSSGPIACAIAALDGNTEIYLLGFDLGPTKNNTFNNVYAGTEFYKKTGDRPVYSGNWIRQLVAIAKDFSHVNFCRVHGESTADITELNNLINFSKCTVEDFCNRFQ
jgi:hypothetical protein